LELAGVKEFSEGWRALRKNPFHGKIWVFPEITQQIYLTLQARGGGDG